MKLVFKKYGIGICLIIGLGSCVKELQPESNGYQAKPVIWAILNLDSTITIVTSGNMGIKTTDVLDISQVGMFLFEDENIVDHILLKSLQGDSQTHRFKIKPKKFKTYTLKLLNSTMEVSGSVQMPNPLQKPDELKLTQGENAQLSYTLLDDGSFSDAYQFKVEIYHSGILIDTATNDTINNKYSFIKYYDKYEEPTLNYNFLNLNTIGTDVFTFPVTDNLFNGKKKTFLFTLQNQVSNVFFRFRIPFTKGVVSDKMICTRQFVLIKCRNISPEYYKFILSENKNNAIFGTPYFNPGNVYSNINGGLGLIGGMAERVDTVWIRK
ncbi:MAG: DUF4249 family protein [Bacteroidia bacterium]